MPLGIEALRQTHSPFGQNSWDASFGCRSLCSWRDKATEIQDSFSSTNSVGPRLDTINFFPTTHCMTWWIARPLAGSCKHDSDWIWHLHIWFSGGTWKQIRAKIWKLKANDQPPSSNCPNLGSLINVVMSNCLKSFSEKCESFSNFSLLCKKHGSQPALRSWHHPLSHLVFERRGIWILQVANTPIEILNRLDNFVQIGWCFHALIDYLELNAVLNSMQIFLAVCICRNPYSFECSLCSGCNENHTETVPFAA